MEPSASKPLKEETIVKINNFLNDFNAALPYAYNNQDDDLYAPLKQEFMA